MRKVKYISALVMLLVTASSAMAQQFEKVQPAGTGQGALLAIPIGVAGEVTATFRDFATLRDPRWQMLTFAQIGAGTADVETTLYNFRHCASCQEIGYSRFILGNRPDVHKYILAGLAEMSLEAVVGHYLRHRVPTRKWYLRFIWTLPQTFSLSAHTEASIHNARVNLGCGPLNQRC